MQVVKEGREKDARWGRDDKEGGDRGDKRQEVVTEACAVVIHSAFLGVDGGDGGE